jgi:hypothetical protein
VSSFLLPAQKVVLLALGPKSWNKIPTEPDELNFRFSGLSVAHYLRKYANLQSFVIYEASEKTRGGAGTWKDNTVRLTLWGLMTTCVVSDEEADHTYS